MTEYAVRSSAPVNAKSGDPLSSAKKPTSKAQALGQVFTNKLLATKMVRGIGLNVAQADNLVLDPCVGPSTFPSVIRDICDKAVNIKAYDVDPEMCRISKLASDKKYDVECADYLLRPIEGNFDFAIMNPPYVRQEWIGEKSRYRSELKSALGIDVPGTANLYVYFIIKTLADLKKGGKLACIVYDSWQSTKYGKWLQRQLDEACSSWSAETVPPLPFEGRLIDATIIFAEKGTKRSPILDCRTQSASRSGMSSIGELFTARRGLRLKQSKFFLTELERSKLEDSTPFVKKISKIEGFVVPPHHPEAALLVSKTEGSQKTIDTLQERLSKALQHPDDNISILTWHRERPEKWYRHGSAPSDLLLFNYYLRHRPRHILNQNQRAYSDNFYGITPSDGNGHMWLAALNATASVAGIMSKARNQGAGLAKLQLFEYREAEVLDVRDWEEADRLRLENIGRKMVAKPDQDKALLRQIDDLVYSVFGNPDFEPERIREELKKVSELVKKPRGRLK